MELLKFTLKGDFAFFKKPDVNTYLYFTYGHIHKVALLGMFGAILGYNGYNQMKFAKKYQNKPAVYPEFYAKLSNLQVAVIPHSSNFSRKVQVFNNSVGYASKEVGGNLIVKEQWLENPAWDIYIQTDSAQGSELKQRLLDRQFVYLPYLGKNDHPADILDVRVLADVNVAEDCSYIDSIFTKSDFAFESDITKRIYKYEEQLPIALNCDTNNYEFATFVYTNATLSKLSDIVVYDANGKNIVFF